MLLLSYVYVVDFWISVIVDGVYERDSFKKKTTKAKLGDKVREKKRKREIERKGGGLRRKREKECVCV